jgi:hypothetical protein
MNVDERKLEKELTTKAQRHKREKVFLTVFVPLWLIPAFFDLRPSAFICG